MVEIMGIEIELENGLITIFNFYKFPSTIVSYNEWRNIFNFFARFERVIVMGDFNSHHTYWGAARSNNESDNFVSLLEDSDLILLNDNSHTYFSHSGTTSSTLDLTLVSSNLATIANWQVLDDQRGSDHLPTSLKINSNPTLEHRTTHKFKLNNVDWNGFANEIDKEIKVNKNNTFAPNINNIKESYTGFVKLIKNAIIENSTKNEKKTNPNNTKGIRVSLNLTLSGSA